MANSLVRVESERQAEQLLATNSRGELDDPVRLSNADIPRLRQVGDESLGTLTTLSVVCQPPFSNHAAHHTLCAVRVGRTLHLKNSIYCLLALLFPNECFPLAVLIAGMMLLYPMQVSYTTNLEKRGHVRRVESC